MTSHFPLDPDGDCRDARGLGDEELASALRASAAGSDPAVASVELLIGQGSWLLRDDVRKFISVDLGFSDGQLMAVVDWESVLAADLPRLIRRVAVARHRRRTDRRRLRTTARRPRLRSHDRNLLRVLRAITRAHGPASSRA
jgi:hypothetical protein